MRSHSDSSITSIVTASPETGFEIRPRPTSHPLSQPCEPLVLRLAVMTPDRRTTYLIAIVNAYGHTSTPIATHDRKHMACGLGVSSRGPAGSDNKFHRWDRDDDEA